MRSETTRPTLETIDRVIFAADHRWPRLQPAINRVYGVFLALWIAAAGLPADVRYLLSPACYWTYLLVIGAQVRRWYMTMRVYCRRNWPTLWICTMMALLWPLLAYSYYLLYTLAARH